MTQFELAFSQETDQFPSHRSELKWLMQKNMNFITCGALSTKKMTIKKRLNNSTANLRGERKFIYRPDSPPPIFPMMEYNLLKPCFLIHFNSLESILSGLSDDVDRVIVTF